jgi:hypothetical protein
LDSEKKTVQERDQDISAKNDSIFQLQSQLATQIQETNEIKANAVAETSARDITIAQLDEVKQRLVNELAEERSALESSREITRIKEEEVASLRIFVKNLEDSLKDKETQLTTEKEALTQAQQQIQFKEQELTSERQTVDKLEHALLQKEEQVSQLQITNKNIADDLERTKAEKVISHACKMSHS